MLRTRISEALKDAMRAKEERATSTLRLILAALKDRDIAARGKGEETTITDEELVLLLQSMIKQRHESRSEEHTSELQSRRNLVCRLLLEKKKKNKTRPRIKRTSLEQMYPPLA